MTVDTICGPFDTTRYKKFKNTYELAVKQNIRTFQFEQQPVDIKFAHYLLEFLKPNFEGNYESKNN